jgi:hypothetical protein
MKIQTLIRHAREAALWRGHDMKPAKIICQNRKMVNDPKQADYVCRKCGAWFQCLTDPLPNQIDVGGNALAIGCK